MRTIKNLILKAFLLISFMILFIACSCEIKEVYIPIKCNIPELQKPKREEGEDFTEFQARLRAYYKNVESDLHFCRTGERILKPP